MRESDILVHSNVHDDIQTQVDAFLSASLEV